MKYRLIFFAVLSLTVIGTLQPASAFAQEPVLEQYSLGVGANTKFDVTLSSKYFGGGSAKAQIQFLKELDSRTLILSVSRKVKKNHIAFALLVHSISIRGFDVNETMIYSETLNGFAFGDSKSGEWAQTMNAFPEGLSRIEIVFYGNYE